MAQIDKLIQKLKNIPRDFTYDEAKKVLKNFGYSEFTKGKTSGSRIAFVNDANDIFRLHKPHPGNELKLYQVNELINFLEERDLI